MTRKSNVDIQAGLIWLNGKFAPQTEAMVSVLSHTLHYGTSVFEGLRAYPTHRGPAIFRLDDHVVRLFHSARIMRKSPPFQC